MSHNELKESHPFTTSIKLTFGKNPGCGAGKGICSLLIDDNCPPLEKQIRGNATFVVLENKFVLSFSLSKFKLADPKGFNVFIGANNEPIDPQIFDHSYTIDPKLAIELGCNLPSPGILVGQPYIMIVDDMTDNVNFSFEYNEVD